MLLEEVDQHHSSLVQAGEAAARLWTFGAGFDIRLKMTP